MKLNEKVRNKILKEIETTTDKKKQSMLKNLIAWTDKDKPLYIKEVWYTDVTCHEVLEVKSPNLIIVREMNAVEKKEAQEKRANSFVAGGFFGHFNNSLQEWDVTPKEDGFVMDLRWSKRGFFSNKQRKGNKFYLQNETCWYYDFNF